MTDQSAHSFDVEEHLKLCACHDASEIDLAKLALSLAYENHVGVSFDRYLNHMDTISRQVKERYDALIEQGSDDDAGVRLAALKFAIVETHEYQVDDSYHEVLESADMMRVIDRGKGAAAALCVLYIDAARKNGWHIKGLNFPGHFLCRIDHDGMRVVFDPAQNCKILETHEMRDMVKLAVGADAELSTDYFSGVGPRQTVVFLYNLIKIRHIEMGDYKAALAVIEKLRLVAPDEYRLLFDAGVLYAKTGDNANAIYCLSDYIDVSPNADDRHEAMLLLQELDLGE